jgi:hypothetical protein
MITVENKVNWNFNATDFFFTLGVLILREIKTCKEQSIHVCMQNLFQSWKFIIMLNFRTPKNYFLPVFMPAKVPALLGL